MSGLQGTVPAVLLSLVSAAGYALAAVAQSRLAASSDGGRGALRALLARGQWWWAVGLNAAGALAHVAALHYGPLTLVQPLGALTLVAALPLGAYGARRRVTRAEWRGALWTLAGLVGLISVTGPATAGDALSVHEALIVAAATALMIAILASGGRRGGRFEERFEERFGRRREGTGSRARAHAGAGSRGGDGAGTRSRGGDGAGAGSRGGAGAGARTAPQVGVGAGSAGSAGFKAGADAGARPPGGAARGRGLRHATASGIASGVGSALTQTLTAALARELPGGATAWWQTALIAVLISAFAVGGLLLSQTAYRGGLAAPLAVVNLSNPAAAAVIGVALLGETFRAGVWGWLVAAAASVVAARGVLLLTTGAEPVPAPPPPSPVTASGQPLPSPRTDDASPTPAPEPAPVAG